MGERLLVVVAHPDDEAFGTGSVLAAAASAGVPTTVACATRGELGEPAPGCGVEPADLGAAREAELRDACAGLGVERVELLGWRDSGVDGDPAPGSLAAAQPAEVAAAVRRVVEDVRPTVVVTLAADDGHRDHAAVRDATVAAVDAAAWAVDCTYLWCLPRSLLSTFTGVPDLGTPDEEVTTVLDATPHLEARWTAIRAHASQVPPYDAMDEELASAFLATDRLRRVRPAWAGGPVERSLF